MTNNSSCALFENILLYQYIYLPLKKTHAMLDSSWIEDEFILLIFHIHHFMDDKERLRQIPTFSHSAILFKIISNTNFGFYNTIFNAYTNLRKQQIVVLNCYASLSLPTTYVCVSVCY